MMRRLFPLRPIDAEARLLYFAGPEAPNAPPDTPDAGLNAIDPKYAFREAQNRMRASDKKIKDLQKSLQQLEQFKSQLQEGKDVNHEELAEHGVVDEDSNGSLKEEVDAKITSAQAELQTHAADLQVASAEADQHLGVIESKGAGGKIDAAFMRVESVMSNPTSSMGEKLAAVITAFMEMQNLLKGMIPSSTPPAPSGVGAEAPDASTSEGKISSVRTMMEETGKTNLTDLRATKQADVTNRQTAVRNLETALPGSKTALQNAQNDLDVKRTALEAAPGDPAKQADVVAAEQTVATQQAAVQTIEQQLQAAKDALAAAEEQVKSIDTVKKDMQDRLDTFNHGRQSLAANLHTMLDGGTIVPAGPQWNKLKVVWDVLSGTVATAGASECDIALTIPNVQDFMKPFAEAGVDTADLQVNADGSLKDPEAFLQTIQTLLTTVRTEAEAKKEGEGA